MKRMLTTTIVLLLLGCQPNQPQETVESTANKQKNFNVIATQLNIPWEAVKLDQVLYITERGGTIAKIEKGNVLRMPLLLKKKVFPFGEGGLLGMTAEDEHTMYLYHTYSEGEKVFNRVVEVELQADTWVEKRVILEKIPGARFHNGGRIDIGLDGKLYVTTGDALVPKNAQDLTSLSGKILRMNKDGTIPEDNPFKDSLVYSYGHRNPQGLAWNDTGSVLYSSEHGQNAHDEINIIQPGHNYGWPIIQGDEKKSGMDSPFMHSGNITWAPSGMDIANGKLYVAALRGEKVMVVDVETKTISTIVDKVGRVRAVRLDGKSAYLITSNRDGRGNPIETDDRLIKASILHNSSF
ncbi:PQQ-dependent sugar dehydrogenase [Bacillus sp. 2205SS5-2]|uniref:PQQ-dependent sugar dehydrogenase n=1 Tax=Bacillus sp. 2205SS5-2 TaxID=3109031 RepID=UPI0030059B4E